MSSSCQESRSRAIPATRRVIISDAALLPHDYSTTPGGTVFSTTPGGTKIIYDRKFLLDCRSSPLAQTPPSCLPDIPGVTSPPVAPEKADPGERALNSHCNTPVAADKVAGDEAQFEMDI